VSVELISPKGSLHPVPFHHVAVGTGARYIHIAGQTARKPERGTIANRDLTAQVGDALRQVGIALNAADATFKDVLHLTFYVPNWDASKIDDFTHGIEAVVEELGLPDPWPPFTMVGIAALWQPDLLVEIEATAIVD
jgi:enamine deaminase RidA (YjgF/YER057c/UK114 family)